MSGDVPEPSVPPCKPSKSALGTSLRSVSLVTGLTFLQLLIQFATQLLLARYFGAGGEMDAFVAALAGPVVIAMIFSGSLGYVLVPVFAERSAKYGQRDAAACAAQIGLYLLALSLLTAAVVASLAAPLTALLCPGFSPEKARLTARLLQILSWLIVAGSLISFLNALFHCYRRFAAPAVAGSIGTLLTLVYIVLMHQRHGIDAVAWSLVFGAAATVAIMLPLFLSHLADAAAWRLAPHPATRRSLWLLWPLVLAALYWRLDPLIDRYLGSYLPAGSISHLGYAWRLTSALMLIGTSGLSIVAFPAIAGHAAARRHDALRTEIAHAFRFLIFMLVPVVAGLAVFHEPVVKLLFERGKFTAADTQAVGLLVALYLGSVVGASFGDLLSRTFYALQDVRTPVIASMIGFSLAAGLKFLLVTPLGAAGLVAATSFYYLLNTAALAAILLARLGSEILAGAGGALLRAGASSLAACFAAGIVASAPLPWAILAAAGAGAVVYLAVSLVLRDEFALKLIGLFGPSRLHPRDVPPS